MPKAVIELEDMPDGTISMKLLLEGGFQVDSNAHQHAHLCLKHLDENCQQLEETAEMQWVDMPKPIQDPDPFKAVISYDLPKPPESEIYTPVAQAIQVVRG